MKYKNKRITADCYKQHKHKHKPIINQLANNNITLKFYSFGLRTKKKCFQVVFRCYQKWVKIKIIRIVTLASDPCIHIKKVK